MPDHTLKYYGLNVIFAITSLGGVSGRTPEIEIGIKLNSMRYLLNGYWKSDVDYNGYSSRDRLSEIDAMKGRWDASGRSV